MKPRLNFYKASPDSMKAMMALEQQGIGSSLESSLIELVRLRISQINGCAYCVDLHSTDARKAGEDERRLAALVVWRETTLFGERERAALEWAESVTRVADTHVPDEVWLHVKPYFTDSEIVDLTMVVNTVNAWNRLAIAFRKLPV